MRSPQIAGELRFHNTSWSSPLATASKIVDRHGAGILYDILLGVVGALAGGWVFTLLGARGVTGFNLYSLAVAIAGSIVILLLFHAVRRTH